MRAPAGADAKSRSSKIRGALKSKVAALIWGLLLELLLGLWRIQLGVKLLLVYMGPGEDYVNKGQHLPSQNKSLAGAIKRAQEN